MEGELSGHCEHRGWKSLFNSMDVSRIDLFFHFCWQLLLYSEKTLIFALMKVPLFSFL